MYFKYFLKKKIHLILKIQSYTKQKMCLVVLLQSLKLVAI